MNPPSPPGYVSNKDSMGGFGHLFPRGATPFPPLDLIYLASSLDERGIPLETLECLGLELSKNQAIAAISDSVEKIGKDGSILLIIRTSAPTLDWDLSVSESIVACYPSVHVGIYGAVVPHVLERIKSEKSISYLICGEPDNTVGELMEGKDPENIAGLVFVKDGEWHQSEERPFMKNLDEIPFPKWEMFPYEKYRIPKSSSQGDISFLPMLTSRGCPVGCHYCPYPVGQGLLWRLRSPENVVDEIEHLVNRLGIEYILFRDPIFSLNQKRVLDICRGIIRRQLKVVWRCETRIDCLKEETLRAMADAGCKGINFGVESAEVEIQANVGRKPITKERFIETISKCHELGISTFGFFIIGLPGDTVETIMNTIEFSIEMKTHRVQFTAASPFVGTKLRDWALSHGLAEEDEYAYVNSYSVQMGNENLSVPQIESLLRFAHLIGNYLLNRKGILKDVSRNSLWYRSARSLADWTSYFTARMIFTIGKWRLGRRLQLQSRG